MDLPIEIVSLVLDEIPSDNERFAIKLHLCKSLRSVRTGHVSISVSGGEIPAWALREFLGRANISIERIQSLLVDTGSLDAWMRCSSEHPKLLPTTPDIAARIAEHGHLEMLMWARANGCDWDLLTCVNAGKNGHLEVLKWARANGCERDEWTCARAAMNGHLEVLKWACANGSLQASCISVVCENAAYGGHLQVLQWARANGCPWNKWTCVGAAHGGHLKLLQWARTNGCPWDSGTIAAAEETGHMDVASWAIDNGCPIPTW